MRRQKMGSQIIMNNTYKLCNQESNDKQNPGTLNKRPATGPGDKNKSLTDGAHLEIHGRSKFLEVVLSSFLQALYLEIFLIFFV